MRMIKFMQLDKSELEFGMVFGNTNEQFRKKIKPFYRTDDTRLHQSKLKQRMTK